MLKSIGAEKIPSDISGNTILAAQKIIPMHRIALARCLAQ